MDQRTATDAERALERTGDELEERIERLDDHIGEARQEAQARREEQDPSEDLTGDSDDDEEGGLDPAGFDDPEADEPEDED
jgi:hypothetical protein